MTSSINPYTKTFQTDAQSRAQRHAGKVSVQNNMLAAHARSFTFPQTIRALDLNGATHGAADTCPDLRDFTGCKELNLSEHSFTELPQGAALPSVEKLYMDHCPRLANVDHIASMTNLKTFDAEGSGLTAWPDALASTPVESVSFIGTQIDRLGACPASLKEIWVSNPLDTSGTDFCLMTHFEHEDGTPVYKYERASSINAEITAFLDSGLGSGVESPSSLSIASDEIDFSVFDGVDFEGLLAQEEMGLVGMDTAPDVDTMETEEDLPTSFVAAQAAASPAPSLTDMDWLSHFQYRA